MGKAAQGFLILVAIIFGCGILVSMIGENAIGSQFTDQCNEIKFVQPSGIFANRDQQYAEHVNEPNSSARLNCAKAEEALASATKIAAQAEVITRQAENKGVSKGLPLGVLLTCLAGGVLVFIVGGILSFLMKGQQ